MKKLLPLLLLAGCATDPSRISAVHDASVTCDPARLAALSAQQRATRTNDTIGVLLIGLPVGRMAGGDHSEEIAKLKGACS